MSTPRGPCTRRGGSGTACLPEAGAPVGWGRLAGAPEAAGEVFADVTAVVAALEKGESLDAVLTAPLLHPGDPIGTAHRATAAALALVQQWLAEDRLAETR